VVTQTLPEVMTNCWFKRLCDRGFKFPDTYIVFDVETSGLQPAYDYVVQFGHMTVQDRRPCEPAQYLLDWTRCEIVSQRDVRERLYHTEDEFRKRQLIYRFSYERLAKEGIDPLEALRVYFDYFQQHQKDGGYFLTHNGVRFDSQLVEHHFRRFLGKEFKFDLSRMIDTGLLELAAQLGLMIGDDESISDFWLRLSKCCQRGVFWSLDKHCIPKYNLVKRHGLNMSQAHTAGFDCKVTHLLMEEFRRQSEEA
jgi:DNA polymerase III epsilon subunit-like protein